MPTYKHPRPAVATDIVVFGFRPGETPKLQVALIRRQREPFKGQLALPGGFLRPGESAEDTAWRELQEEATIKPDYLEQLYTFSDPKRDPRGWIISVAYFGLVRSDRFSLRAGSDADDAGWYDVDQALAEVQAFDHVSILSKALERLTGKVRYAPIGFDLLPEQFTLSELRILYETVLRRKIDGSNFRKKILALGVLTETGQNVIGQHRPAPLYRFDHACYQDLVQRGINFEV